MKNSIYFLYSLFCLVIFSSCNDNGSNPNPVSNEIYPLKIGNYWKYNTKILYPSGEIYKQESFITEVISDTTIIGLKMFLLTTEVNDTSVQFIYTNKSEGLYFYNFLNNNKFTLAYKYPGLKGEKYYFEISDEDMLIEDTDYSYTTPAGTFKCYKYTLIASEIYDKFVYYLAPGVGLIAQEIYDHYQNGIYQLFMKEELTEYGTMILE
jgi:hypothetical protein